MTNLYTGTSGITDLSPALSVAQGTGRLVYGVYQASGYSLYAVDSARALAGGPVREALAPVSPAALPPADRATPDLVTALHDPDTGLPADTSAFAIKPYQPRMSLDYVAQPSIAVGADRFGTYVGGGVALFWSDMLGEHNLATALQINGGFKDASAFVAYQNAAHRWNWGVAAQQVPYYSGYYGAAYDTARGELAFKEQMVVYRQINRELTLMAAYPFNTATRVEFSAGVNNIGFDREVQDRATALSDGFVLFDTTARLPSPAAINLATGTAAFVHDNSFFGATSPVLGERFRFEVAPAVGTISWVSILADYRRYVIPLRPFTIAARVLHYGRYGGDAEDARFTPLFLGYASLIRGYDLGSFSANECPTTSRTCPAFDRLLGSRLFAGNLELRFPLLGVLGLGSGYYGAFPIEAAFFADGGVAYCVGDNTAFCSGDNKAVYSTGAALRVNVFGYAIAEIDFVKPYQRPDKGWYWEVSLTPGF